MGKKIYICKVIYCSNFVTVMSLNQIFTTFERSVQSTKLAQSYSEKAQTSDLELIIIESRHAINRSHTKPRSSMDHHLLLLTTSKALFCRAKERFKNHRFQGEKHEAEENGFAFAHLFAEAAQHFEILVGDLPPQTPGCTP